MQIIKTTIFKPASLVKVWPIEFFKKLLIIKIIPVDNSDIATKLAMNGDRLKYSVRPSGGKGNLPKPYNINAIPTPSLNKRDPKASKFEKKLLKLENN